MIRILTFTKETWIKVKNKPMPNPDTEIIEDEPYQLEIVRNHNFRIGETAVYNRIKGDSFKEMDICWFQPGLDEFYLLECKHRDYLENDVDSIIADLLSKLYCALAFMNAVWLGTSCGNEISGEIPESCRDYPGPRKVYFLFLVGEQEDVQSLIHIKERIISDIGPNKDLYDLVNKIEVWDIENLNRRYQGIISASVIGNN